MGKAKKATFIASIIVLIVLAVIAIPASRSSVESFLFKKALNSALPTFSVADSTSGDYVSCGAGTQGLVSSLNRVSFVGNDAKVGGDAFLVEFRDLPDSQCLKGTIDDSQISADGKTATKDLAISLQSTPQTCNYQIIPSTSKAIKKLNVVDIAYTNTFNRASVDSENLAKCSSYGNVYYSAIYDPDGIDRHVACYITSQSYPVGNLNYDHISWNTKVTASIGGVPYSNSLSYGLDSLGRQSGSSSFYLGTGNEVFVEFGGNLLNSGGVLCPSANSQKVHAVNTGGLWQTKDYNKYNEYLQEDSSGFNNCITQLIALFGDNMGLDRMRSCANDFNAVADSALNSNLKLFSVSGSVQKFSQVSGNIVKLEQSQQLLYPSLAMRVKASTLGVQVDSGKPEIVSATIPDFQSGFSGNINVQVRNIGVGNGAFTASAVCDSPISVKGSSTQTVSPSASATLYIPITGSSSSDVSFNCRVTVTDKQSLLSDSKTVSGKMKGGFSGCANIGGTMCSGDGKNVLVCQADGNSVVQQSCTGGCLMTVTGAVCTAKEICSNELDDDSDGLIDNFDSDCKKGFPWALTIFGTAVAGLIILLLYVNLKGKKKKRGKK